MTSALVSKKGNQRRSKWMTILLICFFIVLAFNDFFQYSGYATRIDWGTKICYSCWPIFVLFVLFGPKRDYYLAGCIMWLFLVIGSFFSSTQFYDQIKNLTSVLTSYVFILILSYLPIFKIKLLFGGLATLSYVTVMISLLLPGMRFSGWNSNSSIILLPCVIFGMAIAYIYGERNFYILSLCFALVDILLIAKLQNRSSVLCTVLFFVGMLLHIDQKNRRIFRATYLALLVFNLVLPFLVSSLMDSSLYNFIADLSADVFRKGRVFNGRELLWPEVIAYMKEQSILWGLNGKRLIYSHNFSLDTISCVGILGYCLFVGNIIVLLEKSFVQGSKNNIFLYGFISLFMLNTFENVMICNNTYMFFQYLLIATPLALKRNTRTSYDTDHFHTYIQ